MQSPLVPLRCLRGDAESPASQVVTAIEVGVTATDEGAPRLLCARCGHPITDLAARVRVDERHEWERTNPHGYTYRFGCFSRAPGCRSQGVPSKQATWFIGFFWQAQGCGRCAEHLGWLFFDGADPDRQFYGLILDRLVEQAGSGPGASA